MGSSNLAGLSAFDEVLAMGSTWPFLGDPTVASGGRQERPPVALTIRGLMHHRRTVGLVIPCRVASPQSPTPFHQATSE